MIFRMALRPASLSLLLFACATACTAQKCKGMEIKHDSPIQYPNAARAAKVQGEVVLQIHIATDGTVTADITSGPSVLAESAKRFVENWTVSWPEKDPPTACAPVLRVSYKLKEDTFSVKEKLPTHILVEAPPIETNEPSPR
ncbi:TonB family protein [Alloacidobacterium dinghuense]|uniref:TonB family protein n=1 Tax=Alloacidobacterium dinghuense TaxID=2763107 RepID=A0A7G8BHL0_9BACT|nr:energy transducer TonB [Alloacidobacterium dinghuense]QNI32030.1 TonB family protein [Alloacidobacterium dinghuense]